MKFSIKTARRVKAELGIDVNATDTYVGDIDKFAQVVQIAWECNGKTKEQAITLAENTTEGEFLNAYLRDRGGDIAKKYQPPTSK